MPTTDAAYMISMAEIQSMARRLGARFRTIREARSRTQEDFSEATGLTQQRISRLENGRGWEKFAEVWEALSSAGVDPVDLFEDGQVADPISVKIRQLLPNAPRKARETALAVLELAMQASNAETEAAQIA